MKRIVVRKLIFEEEYPLIDDISNRMEKDCPRYSISELNWPSYNYLPKAEFAISYTNREILLKYYVTEEWFKAEKIKTNDKVYEDSCVEFFVSPEEDSGYYNFEFNGIGTCLIGFGYGRNSRELTDPAIAKQIRSKSTLGNLPVGIKKGISEWSLTLAIPFLAFFRHQITEPNGRHFSANFYKCGDALPVPHYVTWNRILSEKPDFHRPEFFGELEFKD